MGHAALTVVPVEDMRFAGQLLSYAQTEYRYKSKIHFSGLPVSLYVHTGDWLSYLRQLNQAFNEQQNIQHSMQTLPDMQDWSNHLSLNKQHHMITLRLPKLASVQVLLQLVEWATSVKQKRPSLVVLIAVSKDMLACPSVQQAILAANNKVSSYYHDGQHHQFEHEFRPNIWQPIRAMAASGTIAAISALWVWAQPESKIDSVDRSNATKITHHATLKNIEPS